MFSCRFHQSPPSNFHIISPVRHISGNEGTNFFVGRPGLRRAQGLAVAQRRPCLQHLALIVFPTSPSLPPLDIFLYLGNSSAS